MQLQRYVVTIAASLFISLMLIMPQFAAVDGLGLDTLFWLRSKAFGMRYAAESSPTAVIAIDEESYREAPFRDTPLALWTPYLAKLINALLAANAKVIGFDVIFSTSAQTFLPGHDRDFLLAQHQAAAENKLVLAKIQHSEKPITPFPGYGFAAGGGKNIRAANLFTDRDGVVRRVPLVLQGHDATGNLQAETGFALEIAKRALDASVIISGDKVRLGEHVIPGDVQNGTLINFDAGDPLPTYSLADLVACIAAGKQDFIKDHFGGKIVLIGAILDVEDRRLTSRRLIVEPEKPYPTKRCTLPAAAAQTAHFVRPQIPGVYVHAQAINDLVRGDSLNGVGPIAQALIVLISALAAGIVSFSLSPVAAGFAILGSSVAWTVIDTAAFNYGSVLPLFDPMIGASMAAVLLIAYRTIVTDKAKRQLRQAFGFYLPGNLIDLMLETDTLPALGGEEREITVWFSDLAGFTRASQHQPAQEVVSRLNRYFTAMVEIIESHGGFVDKFIGDGIVALFGAPVVLPNSAAAALAAASDCQQCLSEMSSDGEFTTRIGLHTGLAVIGNIGSPQRFNYTAMGDTVNLAARLESANKGFGTSVLFSEATWIRAGKPSLVRKIGRIRVTGRDNPLTVYALRSVGIGDALDLFDMALELAEMRKFAESLKIFSELAPADGAAALWAEHLRLCMKEPLFGRDELVVELKEK